MRPAELSEEFGRPYDEAILTDFNDLIADRMRIEHHTLARRWFERLAELLPVDAHEVFPSERLLDHVPGLILEISSYLRQPEEGAIGANTAIMEKARELGTMRHAQRASLHQVLREYQLLNGVLVTFVLEEIDRLPSAPRASDSVQVVLRLNQAVAALSQATVEAFVTLYTQTISEQNERLEQFTRMAAHEWRQPLSALQFGVSLLRQPEIQGGERAERALATVERNVRRLVDLTHTLESIARVREEADNMVTQEVCTRTVALEAARQLREMADGRGVAMRVAEDLPVITADVGRLELVLLNLISNAIKYSDAGKAERYVEVSGVLDRDGACRLEISDNGVGIPAHALDSIFQRFTRVHRERADVPPVEGVGLGLSITDDCVRMMGGRIDVRSTEGAGTTFVVTLPAVPRPSVSARTSPPLS